MWLGEVDFCVSVEPVGSNGKFIDSDLPSQYLGWDSSGYIKNVVNFFVVFSSLSSNTSSLSSPAVSPQISNSPIQKNGVQADSTNAGKWWEN